MSSLTPIGITNFRNQYQPFGIKAEDRFGHIYAIGKTGTGKSTLLQSMAIADLENGNGLCVIDPHGDIAENILHYVPKHRIDDVLYFNPQDTDYPIGFNPLQAIHPEYHHLVASALITSFKKIWSDSWGPRLEYILRNALMSLLNYPNATLLDIQPLLTDYVFRSKVMSYQKEATLISFWVNEFEKYPAPLRSEAIAPILNKVGVFSSSPVLRNIVGQKRSAFKMREIMNQKKILICNLSKGAIGEDVSAILGNIIVTAIQLEALYRSTIEVHERIPFFLYVDEMQSFVSLSFADILSEARKFKLGLFLTHQYIDQIDERIRAAIFGNAGTIISFRIGAEDAEVLEKEFYPEFHADDLIRQGKYCMYIKLMIDGATSRGFSAKTVPLPAVTSSHAQQIKHHSRQRYGRLKELVEQDQQQVKREAIKPPSLFDCD